MRSTKITNIDFYDDLGSPYARKRFFWGFVFLGLVFVCVDFAVRAELPLGIARDILDSISVQIVASVTLIVAFYLLYLHFIGPNDAAREMRVIRPADISDLLETLPVKARHYTFWGRSGSYFRSVPLRVLDQQARDLKLITDVEIVLPDPEDERLANSYKEILKSLAEPNEGNQLLAHVIATCVCSAVTTANNKYLRVRIFLSKFLPAFRLDSSDNGAVLTQDDPAKSALFFDYGSEFFEMFRATVRNEIGVSREIVWDKRIFEGKNLEEASTDELLMSSFGLCPDALDPLKDTIGVLITSQRHRYK